MKKFKSYIAGVITGMLFVSLPIFADSYSRAIEALVNFTTVQIDGKDIESDNFVVDGKTYVWIRDVANIFDKEIIWDENSNTANIVNKGSILPPANTIATVNGRTVNDRTLAAFIQFSPNDSKEVIFDNIIKSMLIVENAEKMGMGANETDITEAKDQIEQMKAYYGEDSFKEMLFSIGITVQDYTEILINGLVENRLYLEFYEKTTFDDSKLKEIYEKNMDSYITATTKHILIKTIDDEGNPLSDKDKETAKKKADTLYNQLKKGADFDKLMSENSEDIQTKDNADGFSFKKEEMVEAYEEASFSQEINKIYPPVTTDYGYHIILVTDRKTPDFEELKKDCFDIAFKEYFDNLLKEWHSDADVVINQEVYEAV